MVTRLTELAHNTTRILFENDETDPPPTLYIRRGDGFGAVPVPGDLPAQFLSAMIRISKADECVLVVKSHALVAPVDASLSPKEQRLQAEAALEEKTVSQHPDAIEIMVAVHVDNESVEGYMAKIRYKRQTAVIKTILGRWLNFDELSRLDNGKLTASGFFEGRIVDALRIGFIRA